MRFNSSHLLVAAVYLAILAAALAAPNVVSQAVVWLMLLAFYGLMLRLIQKTHSERVRNACCCAAVACLMFLITVKAANASVFALGAFEWIHHGEGLHGYAYFKSIWHNSISLALALLGGALGAGVFRSELKE